MQRGNSKELIDQHVEGGSEALDARKMTFAALAEHSKRPPVLVKDQNAVISVWVRINA
jgi:hypothetical protein